jgi:hypothetical protein
MSKGIFAKASFCPFCGVRSLERDRYGETLADPRYKNEFSCTACGMGFSLGPSMRYQQAIRLAKAHREMRPADRPPKEKPADTELFTLQKYAERVGYPGQVVRSASKVGIFMFLDNLGKSHGSTGFERAMCLLRGYELATNIISTQDGLLNR